MLYFPQTRIELSVERPLVAGAVINAEGAALAGVNSASGYGVQSTTGTNDVFAGVAINNPINPVSLPFVETLVVPATGILPLSNVPIAGTIAVFNASTNAAFTQASNGTAQSALTGTQFIPDTTYTNSLDFVATLQGVA